MVLEQHYLGCLAHASYLNADEVSGEAAVIDPQRDISRYVEDAERFGVRIRHVSGSLTRPLGRAVVATLPGRVDRPPEITFAGT